MDPWTSIVVIGAALALVAALHRMTRGAPPSWARAAGKLGLQVEGRAIRGRSGGFEVRIEPHDQGGSDGATRTRITITGGDPPIPSHLWLNRESLGTRIDKVLGGEDILVGEESFDVQVHVRGLEPVALAVLNRSVRKLVLEQMERGTVVQEGRVAWACNGLVDHEIELVSRTNALLKLAAALQLGESQIPERLAANALQERDMHVRLRNLRVLHDRYGTSDIVLHTDRDLLGDHPAPLRLQAALHLGLEGFDGLAALAADESADVEVRCSALQQLMPAAAGRADCESLAHNIQTAVEPQLILLLHTDNANARLAIVQALGSIGSVAAVEPLLQSCKGTRADARYRRACQEAIDHIQARLGNVDAGRLSIAETAAQDGALSLAQEQGMLSLPDDGAAPLRTAAEPEGNAHA